MISIQWISPGVTGVKHTSGSIQVMSWCASLWSSQTASLSRKVLISSGTRERIALKSLRSAEEQKINYLLIKFSSIMWFNKFKNRFLKKNGLLFWGEMCLTWAGWRRGDVFSDGVIDGGWESSSVRVHSTAHLLRLQQMRLHHCHGQRASICYLPLHKTRQHIKQLLLHQKNTPAQWHDAQFIRPKLI